MGAREFTDAMERAQRRAIVAAVGERLYGASWQTPLSEALSAVTGRPLGRARVAQWMLAEGAKPVPLWVFSALPVIALEGAERLRRNADELERMFTLGIGIPSGSPSGDCGEPEPKEDGEPPQESGPPPGAAQAAAEPDFDVDAFVQAYAHMKMPRPTPEPEPEPAPPTGWRSRWAEEHNANWRGVIPR